MEIFHRPKDFDPELDPIVRIEIGRLRSSLNEYYLNVGRNDPIRIFIPKGSYIPTFIPQEVPEPVRPENQEEMEKAILSLAEGPSIVVLPFKNLTGDPSQEYFVQGFADELSNELSKYEVFRVIGYHVRFMPNNSKNENELLRSIGAKYLLDGSVRKDKFNVKISIKLVDVHTREQLWCEQFKRNLTTKNLISIQEDIAHEAIIVIANEYGIIPQKIKNDSRNKTPAELETYEAILRYYYYQTQHTPETISAAFKALEEAIVKEPENGVVTAMLASIYGNRYMLDLSNSADAMDKMVELSKKAIKFDPNNQLVRIVYAWSYFVLEDKDRFLSEINNALVLKPRSPFRIGAIGFFLSLYGEWDRGKALLDKAMSQSIGFPAWYFGATSLYYYRLNEYEKAYEQALKYDVPGIFWGPLLRAAALGKLGRKSDARKDIHEIFTLKPEFEKKARYLIRRYVKEEKLVDHIIEGLKKAGVSIKLAPAKTKHFQNKF